MRPAALLLAALLLSACAEYATPGGQAAPNATQPAPVVVNPDAAATAIMAIAAATYQAQVTSTAGAATQQAAQAQSTALQMAISATQQAVVISGTLAAAAYTQRAWEVGQVATQQKAEIVAVMATERAVSVTLTAVAAPTVQYAAQQAETARQERDFTQWVVFIVGACLAALAVVVAGYNHIDSLSVKRRAEAYAIEQDAAAKRFRDEQLAIAQATRWAEIGGRLFVFYNHRIVDSRPMDAIASPTPDGATIEQGGDDGHAPPPPAARPGEYPPENTDAIALLDEHFRLLPQLDALNRKKYNSDWPTNRIAGTREFDELGVREWASGGAWQRVIHSLGDAVHGDKNGTRVQRIDGRMNVRDLYNDLLRGRLVCL